MTTNAVQPSLFTQFNVQQPSTAQQVSAKSDLQEATNDKFEKTQQKKDAKPWKYALGSFLLPGLGQFLQGRHNDGFNTMFRSMGAVGMVMLGSWSMKEILRLASNRQIRDNKIKPLAITGLIVSCIGMLGGLTNNIHATINAYKGAKKFNEQ